MFKEKDEYFLSALLCMYGLNFNFSFPETKKFVDLLFKTLETQVYDVAPVSTTTALPHTAPTDTAPAVVAEPAPTKMPVTIQPAEPLLSEPLSVENPPSTQTLPGHQVSFSILRLHWIPAVFYEKMCNKEQLKQIFLACVKYSV
jgi:hypothetical protein